LNSIACWLNKGDVELRPIDRNEAPANVPATMTNAQVYQIGSTRDDTPARWWVGAELPDRMPRLLAVSTNGVGLAAFNVGVEIGQFTIVLLAGPVLAALHRYVPPRVTYFPLAAAASLVVRMGGIWFWDRALGT
jgi:hypothetical protein